MKKYIGTKEIMAEPMNECIAVEKGFARPNTDNHEWRSGLSCAIHQSGWINIR